MTVDFEFAFGEPPNNQSGRWLEGSVKGHDRGYTFLVNLWYRSGATLGAQSVTLDVDRSFLSSDFVLFVKLASTAELETATRVLRVTRNAGEPLPFESGDFVPDNKESILADGQADLQSLASKLETARKRQMLGRFFAKFGQGGSLGV
jgi:hypothetical protein